MQLIMPLLVLFVIVGLRRRSVRAGDLVVFAAAIMLGSIVYVFTWTP
jgi:hypothetical protein